MVTPALNFVETPFHPNDEGNILLQFRERGFVRVENVFERDSVDPFLAQIQAIVRKTDKPYAPYDLPNDNPLTIWPAKAPRMRHILRSAFAWGRQRPQLCLFHPSWLVKPHNPDERLVHDWHKDGDHESFGTLNGHYQYPSVIHVNIYFADMTLEHGPTYVIPRSHRDGTLSPYNGAKEEPLMANKGDIVMWDQRMWHRASPRTIPGLRIVAIWGFCSFPLGVEKPFKLTPAQKRAYQETKDPAEKILFGGPFDMES